MRFFWNGKIFWKGALKKNLWTSPQSCPFHSLYPDGSVNYKKQLSSSRHIFPSKRNVSLFPSFQGSVTVESAFAVPLFLFFCIQMISLIALIELHSVLESALHQEVSKAALRAYAYEALGAQTGSAAGEFLEALYLRERILQRAGRTYLDRSMIEGGSGGIRVLCAENSGEQDCVDVVLYYRVEPVVDILGFSGFTMANRCRMKAWTGYRLESKSEGETEEEMVYVTETGSVYHKSRNCTHLMLSVREVKREILETLRNAGGGKYYPCESCGEHAGGSVYVTEEGDRYHSSFGCSRLKRTVYSIPISKAGGRGPCSRCCARA